MNLHLVLGHEDCRNHDIEAIIMQAIKGGITHVQLREKHLSTRAFLETGRRLQKILALAHVPLIINDRIDIALTLNAAGAHLGQTDLPYPEARTLLGPKKIIGLTVHSPQEMLSANNYAADYVGVGPVFATLSKEDAPSPLGVTQLTELTKLAKHPVIAIGGINAQNLPQLLPTGISGIAVISAITHTADPEAATQALAQILRQTSTC